MSPIEVKLIASAVLIGISFLPIWSKLFPYRLCVGRDDGGGWHIWIEPIE